MLLFPLVFPLPRLPVFLMLHLLFSFGSFAVELRTKDILLFLLGLRLLCLRSQILRSGRALSSIGCQSEKKVLKSIIRFCSARQSYFVLLVCVCVCVCVCVVPSLPGHRSDRTGANSSYQTWTGAELLSVLLRNPELTRSGLHSS